MIADRKEAMASFEAKHDRKRAELMPLFRLVAGAAPIMDTLVASEQWTRYQQLLQGMVDRWKAQRDSAKEKLAGPSIWDPSEIHKLKGDILAADATVSAFELAIQLPKAISAGGDDAQKMVEEFEKKNAPTEQTA
jgi:hypothetical protein